MIVYTPLWQTMKLRKITKYQLVHKYGIAQNTISRMMESKPTSSKTINDLCKILNCKIEDIIKYVKDEDGP